jgi:hypothetical protein
MFHSTKGISPAGGCQFDKRRVMLQFGDKFRVARAAVPKGNSGLGGPNQTIESESQLQNTAARQFPHSKIPLTPTLSRRERECRIQVVPLTERLIIAE